ncbi:MAG: ComEA family DNA-binding protein [Planctomycetota bacterium]|nr:ComEA family DNA-binding protein [Planctomycetota bacterium]
MSEGPPSIRPRDAATWALVGALMMLTVMGTIWAFHMRQGPKPAPTATATPETSPTPTPTPAPTPASLPAAASASSTAPVPDVSTPANADAVPALTAEPTASAEKLPAPLPPPPVAAPIDLNRATKEQLEMLPGIGPALAQRIIDDRTARGPFRSVDDLDRVSGIGKKTIDKFRAKVTVGP